MSFLKVQSGAREAKQNLHVIAVKPRQGGGGIFVKNRAQVMLSLTPTAKRQLAAHIIAAH